MNIDDLTAPPIMYMIGFCILYLLIFRYIRPLGLALDKKLYKLTLGRTRLRIFGVSFISYYCCVLAIWFSMVWFLYKKGLFDIKTMAFIMMCITLVTFLVAAYNLRKSHQKDLTLFKRRSGERKAHRKSVGLKSMGSDSVDS